MWATLKSTIVSIHQSFHKSGTLVFARVQVMVGIVWEVLSHTDLSSVIGNPKYLTYWLIFSGVITEMTRRSGTYADEDGHLMPRRDDQTVTVNVNTAPAPASPIGPTSGNTK
jgi:hypothetical protein